MNFNTTLHKLGLSPIEANVFIILCKHGSLTGYEVAKLTGISRSNVYSALYSLLDKGKCFSSQGETTKYIAISKEELLLSTKREAEITLQEIADYYPSEIVSTESHITIKSYDNVLSKLKNTILLANSHLYLLCNSNIIELIKEELVEVSSHIRINLICDNNLSLPPCITIYNRDRNFDGFHMIVDTEVMITGQLDGLSPQCLFSKDPSLVKLMREAFSTELEIIKINNSKYTINS